MCIINETVKIIKYYHKGGITHLEKVTQFISKLFHYEKYFDK